MKRFLLPILTGVAAVAAHAQESDSVRMYRLQQIEVTATRATPVRMGSKNLFIEPLI